jgi:hypothetical protein
VLEGHLPGGFGHLVQRPGFLASQCAGVLGVVHVLLVVGIAMVLADAIIIGVVGIITDLRTASANSWSGW